MADGVQCFFCANGPNYHHSHPECLSEGNRRAEAGLCIMCGEGAQTHGCFCDACDRYSKFRNYPRGA